MSKTPSRPGGVLQSSSKKQRVALLKHQLPSSQQHPSHDVAKETNAKFPYESLDSINPLLSSYVSQPTMMSLEGMVEALVARGTTDRLTDKTLLLENPVRAGSLNRQAGLGATKKQDQFSTKLQKQESIAMRLKSAANQLTFSQFHPLHSLWKQQMTNAKELQSQLIGSMVTVMSSPTVSFVGCKGIVLADTREVLVLITELDKVSLIPKRRLSIQVSSNEPHMAFKITSCR